MQLAIRGHRLLVHDRALLRRIIVSSSMRRLCVAVFVAATVLSLGSSGTRAQSSVEVMASGLNNPRDLRFGPDGLLYVIEAGAGGGSNLCLPSPSGAACYGPTGSVTRITGPGAHQRVLSGLPSLAPAGGHNAIGPVDFDFGFERGWIVVGLGANPAARDAFAAAGVRLGTLIRVTYAGQWDYVADIAAHEATFNPDGGAIFSDPSSVRFLHDRVVVADAGANAVLSVGLDAQIHTLTTLGSTPSAVTDGPDGFLFVADGGTAVGAGRVVRLRRDGGSPTVVASGFTNIVDIAFERSGAMWVLESDTDGAGPGENGRLIRIADGQPTVFTSALVRPGGLALGLDGAIYVTNRSTTAGGGQVLRLTR
jgi:hypothetical protein